MLQEEKVVDKLKISIHLRVQLCVQLLGQLGVAVGFARVCTVERVDEGFGMTGKQILEQLFEIYGDIVVIDIFDDLWNEIDENPLWNLLIRNGIFEMFTNFLMFGLHDLNKLQYH